MIRGFRIQTLVLLHILNQPNHAHILQSIHSNFSARKFKSSAYTRYVDIQTFKIKVQKILAFGKNGFLLLRIFQF